MIKYVRKATRVGKRSLAIVLPAPVAKALRIHERQKLSVHQSGDKLIVEDWKK